MTDAQPILNEERIAGIINRLNRPIALVGLMGVGKSTIGRRLANALDRAFIDADDEIEDAAQRKISEIFEQFGEDYFRDGERRVIARLIEEHDGVIATGGGAFVNDETRALILENSIAVWIDCDIDTLVERTARKNTRPLLKTGDPREILAKLYKERKGFYSQAQIHVMSDAGPHDYTVIKILEALDSWL
uniref:shikimate kinase n=1 Tax=uncultured Altererythrobacter sp. TaxID=500840 RepID=UPI00261D68D3|nr:shikimate kinase [uncultured Altererythrobacter sp.]